MDRQVTDSAAVFQANRTQSLNYGCIVENPQTHEVRGKGPGWGVHRGSPASPLLHWGAPWVPPKIRPEPGAQYALLLGCAAAAGLGCEEAVSGTLPALLTARGLPREAA